MAVEVPDEQFLADAGMLRMMLDNIADGVYFTDRTRTIRYWNKAAERLSGYAADEVVGRRCADKILMHVDEQGRCLCTSSDCPLTKCFKGEVQHVERVYMHHKQGHRVPVRICAGPIRNAAGEVIGGIETFHDVSAELTALRELDTLREQALLCPLTGVGNRRYGEQMLATHLERLAPGKPGVGVLLLDIDNFKAFNDRYGHTVGDVVLKMVARTVSSDLRASDFIARWGGEEFLVLLPRMMATNLEQHAKRICLLIAHSCDEASSGKLAVTASIGATMAQPGETAEQAVERADALMYRSKASGKNRATVG